MTDQVSDFTKRLWELQEKKRIEESGLIGYCICCGEPHYVGKSAEHNTECIWYRNEQ